MIGTSISLMNAVVFNTFESSGDDKLEISISTIACSNWFVWLFELDVSTVYVDFIFEWVLFFYCF
jgi:hypothetical protein